MRHLILVGSPLSQLSSAGRCEPDWVGSYRFDKALRFRLADEGPGGAAFADPVRSILLWGGADSTGSPNLEPAFVVDAPAARPVSGGDHRITGRTADGSELFLLSFAMPATADGDEGSSFVFAIPVQPEWEGNLASITLSGPGGTVTLDGATDRPMAILARSTQRASARLPARRAVRGPSCCRRGRVGGSRRDGAGGVVQPRNPKRGVVTKIGRCMLENLSLKVGEHSPGRGTHCPGASDLPRAELPAIHTRFSRFRGTVRPGPAPQQEWQIVKSGLNRTDSLRRITLYRGCPRTRPTRCRPRGRGLGRGVGPSAALIQPVPRGHHGVDRTGCRPPPALAIAEGEAADRLGPGSLSPEEGAAPRFPRLGTPVKGSVNGRLNVWPFDPICLLFEHNRSDHGLTARTADRAVLIEVRRLFLPGIHAIWGT